MQKYVIFHIATSQKVTHHQNPGIPKGSSDSFEFYDIPDFLGDLKVFSPLIR